MTSPMKTIVSETSGPGESGRADTILCEDFRQPAGEEVLIQSDSLTTNDPAFKAAVQAVIAGVSKLALRLPTRWGCSAARDGLPGACARA